MSYDDRINRVCEYISHNLDKDLTLDRVSDIAALSKFHFHRVFSAYTGMNLCKFIQLARLKKASFQLAFQSNMRIITIALDANFESPEAFARAFKRTFEQTPSEFRRAPEWPLWHSKFDYSLPQGEKEMEVKIVNFTKTTVAVLEHLGTPKHIYDSLGTFIEWRKHTGLSPVTTSQSFGIAYDDPETTPPDEFRFDLCGSINQDVPANTYGIKTGYIPGGRCAVVRHTGSLDHIAGSVYFLYKEWLPGSREELRDYPCFFHYLNRIPDVDECDLLTDVYLPVK